MSLHYRFFSFCVYEHTIAYHPEEADNLSAKESKNLILKLVAEQTTSISNEISSLRSDTKNAFAEISKTQDICINNLKTDNNEKCKVLGNTVVKLFNKISRIEKALASKYSNSNKGPVKENVKDTKPNSTKMNEAIPQPKTPGISRSNPPPPTTHAQPLIITPAPTHPQLRRTSFLKQPKVLYVGDSVGHTANLRLVEKSSKCRISSAVAYSSVRASDARWPEASFEDIVRDKLNNKTREGFEVLVMSSPTVDISNLDTNLQTNKGATESLEEKVITSSKNMFNIAQEALLKNSDLKKVVIMEHPPMFDNTLKSQLADLANSTLSQLWAISPVRSKIFIGRHSLVSPGSGSMHLARFKDYYSGKYDGIHLYGRTGERDYTDSVKSILLLALSDQHPNLVNNETEFDTK